MIGTSLGKTLTLDALPAVTLDAEQGEWSLKNIVYLGSDGTVGHHVIRWNSPRFNCHRKVPRNFRIRVGGM